MLHRSVLRHITGLRNFHSDKLYRATSYGSLRLPNITNEPINDYAKGSKERELLLEECEKYLKPDYKPVNIPIVVNGKEYFTGNEVHREMPSDINRKLCTSRDAPKDLIEQAIEGALEAKSKWERMSLDQRSAVFLRAADLLSGKHRYKVLAATMMGQGKTMYQAEIDAAAEAVDFLRFNALFASRIYNAQIENHAKHVWNKLEYRPLEGFVAAISPFNFTAIGSNLSCAPAQMGNVVLWKPSHTSILSNYYVYELLREAGLPDGVIQFVPSHGPTFGESVFSNKNFTALHFTGGTKTFQGLYRNIANNLEKYKTIPRIIAETGGKNFHVMHTSADFDNFINNTVRGAFEYSGQKCSAPSRVYVPKSKWNQVRDSLVNETRKIRVGQPNDPTSFLSCVIDKNSFEKISGFLTRAKQDPNVEILCGGNADKSRGYFIEPTIIYTTNPKSETMVEEIFGPVLTCYVYDDAAPNAWNDVLQLVDQTSPYALTGSVFARDRSVISTADEILKNSSGNFYINDKSTGAVVGQQPFGGARVSGTNDKAGSEQLLWRFTSVRTIKENLEDLTHWSYPSVDLEK